LHFTANVRTNTPTTQEPRMKSSHTVFVLPLIAALAVACTNTPDAAPNAAAAWRIDAANSTINFVTMKAGQAGVGGVGEVQRFSRFSGGMNASGRVSFDVDLASVETGVDIRDERLRTMLFNVKATPQANFVAQIEPATIQAVPAAGSRDVELNGQLTLAGQTKPVVAKLRVSRMAGGDLQVATRAPIVVDANQYGLKPGVEALREVMGLNFLASAAPVTFSLVLNQQR
jgi:polyisoprenoid-binding protein YceI